LGQLAFGFYFTVKIGGFFGRIRANIFSVTFLKKFLERPNLW